MGSRSCLSVPPSNRLEVSSTSFTRPVGDDDGEAVALLLTQLGNPTDAGDVSSRLREVLAEGGVAFLRVDESGRALGFFSVPRHWVITASGRFGLILPL